jgi:DNA repair exonuclease SbcCD nuclease subunit
MAVVRFLQVSDFHLGRPFGWLPPERRSDRRHDQRRALESSVRLAIERGVHAILLPGDLFDLDYVDADTLAFAVHAFDVTGCPPVFIAPGNHDPCSSTSPYWNPALLRARGASWPAHVHVFDSPGWTAKPLPGMEEVRIWGRCSIQAVESAARPLAPEALAGVDARRGEGVNVAVFHGSREGFLPPGQKAVAPFTDAEVMASPFDYLAVGHIHTPQSLEADAPDGATSGAGPWVRLAYAGAAISLDVSELGRHGAYEVRIESDGGGPPPAFGGYPAGTPRAAIEFIELDKRRVYDLAVDVTGATSAEQVGRRVLRALDQAGAGDADIVVVRLSGRLMRGVRYAAPGPEVRPRAFHVRLDPRALRPDYDLAALRACEPVTTEERFARALLDQLDAETDPARRADLESALYYGLDAFRLHEVVPAYEELGA